MNKIIFEYDFSKFQELKIDKKGIESYRKEVEESLPRYIEEEKNRNAETEKCIKEILIGS